MHWLPTTFIFACACLCGCATSRSSQVNTPLITLPNGGQLFIQVTHTTGNDLGPGKGPLAVWKEPDGQQKVLITLVPAPGSPVSVLKIDNSSPHYSPDGNRVWLVRDGQTVASFDYGSGVAILGPAGQPEWARPDAPGETGTPVPPDASGTVIMPR